MVEDGGWLPWRPEACAAGEASAARLSDRPISKEVGRRSAAGERSPSAAWPVFRKPGPRRCRVAPVRLQRGTLVPCLPAVVRAPSFGRPLS